MKKPQSIHTCNVVHVSPTGRQFWQFGVDKGNPSLKTTLAVGLGSSLPLKLVGKDWHTLYQPRLNLACLPSEKVFLRVVQLPTTDTAEIASMLEFQIEKLSPVPISQMVWSYALLPSSVEAKSTDVITAMVERDYVEGSVKQLETEGYFPDRIELPQLDQLLARLPDQDGVWLYPSTELGNLFCLAAWWYGGMLRNLQMIQLPSGCDQGLLLQDQLLKAAWAGEVEGWLNFPLQCLVVGDESVQNTWLPLLKDWVETPVEVRSTFSRSELAEFTARRAIRHEHALNLLPVEFADKYRQTFVDGLWMRALGVVFGVYLLGVLGYFGMLQFRGIQQGQVEGKINSLKVSYTNALQLKEQVAILQDQYNLKYASMDCLRVASELLPPEMTMTWLVFSKGQTMELHGNVPSDQASKLSDYNDALRQATAGDQAMFSRVSPPTSTTRPGASGVSWTFTCELNRAEVP
ncbi:MAG: hypothetical protein NTV12_02310 [Verrucomicrobia bacterium]|nr:hypothetical protein [Verrucomicrobiota bacterium]